MPSMDPSSLPNSIPELEAIYTESGKHLDKLDKEESNIRKQKLQAKKNLTKAQAEEPAPTSVPEPSAPVPEPVPPPRFNDEFETVEEALAVKSRLEQELHELEAQNAALEEEKLLRRPSTSVADTSVTRASEEDVVGEGAPSDCESFNSESERLVNEMHQLERLLQQAERGESPRPSASNHSFCTAAESVGGGCSTARPSRSCSPHQGTSGAGEAQPRKRRSNSPFLGKDASAGDGASGDGAPAKGAGEGAGADAKGAGKGSGKGKGKSKAPPPPPASARKGPSGAPSPKAPAAPKTSRLVSLHWKVSQEPETANPAIASWLAQITECGPFSDKPVDAEAGTVDELPIPEIPTTLFSPLANLEDAPSAEATRDLLEQFFEKCPTSTWAARTQSDLAAQSQAPHEAKRTAELDTTKLRMLGVVIQKWKMELAPKRCANSGVMGAGEGDTPSSSPARPEGSAQQQVILSIKRGVLRCDYDAVRLETLCALRTVLKQHDKADRPVCRYAERHGEAAILQLECPEEHRLVFELSKVPQVNERLECMIFHSTYPESLVSCRHNLDALSRALQMLSKKRETIRRCFVTALRLGQSLSRQLLNGFQLSTLEKLTQTKSSKYPKLSVLHFVLALMSREDASNLFNDADIALLHGAKTLGTDKVVQESFELAKGLFGVQALCKDGQYASPSTGEAVTMERRRMSHAPPSEQEAAIDTDDRFHEVMETFVADNLSAAEDLVEYSFDTILTYKELAVYFDDLKSVYPPPKSDKDPTQDLCDIFHRFAEDIRRHRDEVDRERLRELLVANGPADAEALFARQVTATAAREVPPLPAP